MTEIVRSSTRTTPWRKRSLSTASVCLNSTTISHGVPGLHGATAFPELAGEGKLRAYRHTGMWLTVNTPKELRRADEYVSEHPEWLA